MPATAVEVLHDDGRWYLAQLLGQHRDRETGDWRCGVRYSVAPGWHTSASCGPTSAGRYRQSRSTRSSVDQAMSARPRAVQAARLSDTPGDFLIYGRAITRAFPAERCVVVSTDETVTNSSETVEAEAQTA